VKVKYTVHIFPIVRVKIPDIEADSHEEAMKKAEAGVDFNSLLNNSGGDYVVEYADDLDAFHVDEENDPEYQNSVWYDKFMKPI